MDIAQRYDGMWNIWCSHGLEAASAWHVVHVAASRRDAIRWVKKNERNAKWLVYQK